MARPDSPPPLSRTRAQGARSRERILDAAERLMAERGFAATGIAAISKASGLPTSSIYWHFESKEGLLGAVMERSSERWLTDLGSAQDLPADPRERLRYSLLRLEARPAEFLRLQIMLTLERREVHPSSLERIRRVRARGQEILRSILEDFFAHAGSERAARIARECVTFAMAFGEGCYVTRQIDPEGTRLAELAAQLETALLAIGERILAEGRPA